MARYVNMDAADDIIANNTPISEWVDSIYVTWIPTTAFRNEDSTPIDNDTQVILISDAPDISDWYISSEQKFIPGS